MSIFDSVRLTEGHLARHTPAGSGAPGREAAIIDIGQDLLLAYLEKEKLMDKVALKGGTAIRKLYAGREGRFSLDLDFAADDDVAKTEDRTFDFISEIDGLQLGPFTYSISERRNKWYIALSSSFNDGDIFRTKLDFASYPWLPTVKRRIVTLPIHGQYGFELPEINTVRLEENIAEKIARLNRSNTARDLYDLNWIMENPSVSTMVDKQLLRRLAVLKIWVDSHGMHYGNVWWRPAHEPSVFDPDRWLDERDPEAMGNQSSQWFALYYLDRIIKEKYRIKYYTRYMDDLVLIHEDKQYLMECLHEIRGYAEEELKLEFNQKTQIFPIRQGVDYLGWHFYLTDTGKVIRRLRTSNKRRFKQRLKKFQKLYSQGDITADKIKMSLASYNGHLKHGHTWKLKKKVYGDFVLTRDSSSNEEKP